MNFLSIVKSIVDVLIKEEFRGRLIKYSPESMSTPRQPKFIDHNKELAVGSQKLGAHKASVKPDLVPLKTMQISSLPFGTENNSVIFLSDVEE